MCCLVGKAPLFIALMWNGNAACAHVDASWHAPSFERCVFRTAARALRGSRRESLYGPGDLRYVRRRTMPGKRSYEGNFDLARRTIGVARWRPPGGHCSGPTGGAPKQRSAMPRRATYSIGARELHGRCATHHRPKKSLPAFGEPAFERGYAGRQIDFHAEVHHGPAERVHGAKKIVLTALLAHLADTNDRQSERA